MFLYHRTHRKGQCFNGPLAKWKRPPGDRAPPAPPPGSPVYWPRKVTLSGRPVLLTPFVPSRAACGLFSVVLPLSENSLGEAGSDSEPGMGRGASEGEGTGDT